MHVEHDARGHWMQDDGAGTYGEWHSRGWEPMPVADKAGHGDDGFGDNGHWSGAHKAGHHDRGDN